VFTVSVQLRTGIKSEHATGPRRALAHMTEFRELYGVEPVVSDGARTYTDAELQQLIDASGP